MPVYILLLVAAAPVLTMVATAGDAFGREARVAALIALTIILPTVVAWLVAAAVRTVLASIAVTRSQHAWKWNRFKTASRGMGNARFTPRVR
jgi:hypothetical protein